MSEAGSIRRRGRPPGSKNKAKAPSIALKKQDAPTVDLNEVKVPEVVLPKSPKVPDHRKGAGYVTPWRQLEDTLAILPKSVMQRISTTNEIDLLIQRVQGLIDKIQPGESAETWSAMKDQMYHMEKARRTGEESDFWDGWDSLISLVTQGDSESKTWKDIYEAIEILRRLKETELKRHTQEMASMAREEVLLVIKEQQDMFRFAVVGEIHDNALAARVLRRYQEFIDRKFNVSGVLGAYEEPPIEAEFEEVDNGDS